MSAYLVEVWENRNGVWPHAEDIDAIDDAAAESAARYVAGAAPAMLYRLHPDGRQPITSINGVD